ncbi:CoA-acylating methylmalonate-semialdehyde dehydrogenase [Paenibacillus sp. N1-5-1-14]|uniref:CoA-acylating methylmalonate-semialdehyde dehydrogenase n=1 Tax=Paenibacillus radicibacter TaxID=2972488 RepID=UPI0021594E65|nr:CoA-acylating methylmalonate-semialdehyde dehydrogenase [Paenibacillus radicibacter]MCR8641825.1 CoA-acylating methylmalonate-semialdehyde dehydrogenase [Paenibacillus radicibacter]
MTVGTRERLNNFIDGQWVISNSGKCDPVYNPATGEVIAEVPLSTKDELNLAVEAAERAFVSWSKTPVPNRTRILYSFIHLLNQHTEELAHLIVMEHGKNLKDSLGEVQRGIETVEAATATPALMMGQTLPEIATGIEGSVYRYPLGVVAGITPFNFPMMVPLWLFPMAIACGNTFVLKPSERTPLLAERLVQLMVEAGLPSGVLNMVHGAHDVVNGILEHPTIKAVSFVGSQPVAEYVYRTGTGNGKRVQALAGAKNHAIVMPDCNLEKTVQGIILAAFASAGERCMATSVVAVVDEIADRFIELLVSESQQLKVGSGLDPTAFVAPLIRDTHRQRVIRLIESGVVEQADLLLDGRNAETDDPNGYYLGATIFDHVTMDMKIWQEEIFAPVLSIVRIKDLDEGITLTNQSKFANGAIIYTSSGEHMRHFRENIDAGMIGINVNVPAPMAMFTFAGHKDSFYGDLGVNGTDGVMFYTRKKMVTSRWF